jgi:anoctamin-10
VYLPTAILITINPILTNFLTGIARQLNDFENYETTEAFDRAMTQKLFILNFISSYLGIFLTAFVYVPFGSVVVPYLDIFSLTARPFASKKGQLTAPKFGFAINPSRLRNQVFYFTVTAQVINLVTEVIVPYVKRKAGRKVEEIKADRAAKAGGSVPAASVNDAPEESAFLERVRAEANLDTYDVTVDLREMVVQFGYMALFAVVWPLVPVSFIINNWIELRSDAVKICVEMQRPTPFRADGIGPWLDSLGFLTWLGSITTAALVHLFSNDGVGPDGKPYDIKGWALLLTIFFSEHIYLVVQMVVRYAISKIDSPGMARERAEKYMVRKRYLEEHFGASALELPPGATGEKITRQSLEDEARESTLRATTASDRFWERQRGWQESVKVGAGLIDRMAAPDEAKKSR